MNINRHNYETFFLLYVDNELSVAERKAVDVFVQENPDLQGELLLLQDTVSKADEIVLKKKDWLFMEEGATALQENLLLYADDELNQADKKSIEALVATDRVAHAEWNILRQTKLEPDNSVVFEDKKSLYRTEGGRVVRFKWWRAAAAAFLLGLGLWTGVSVYKNNFKTASGTEGIAKGNETKPGQVKSIVPVNANAADNSVIENIYPQKTETAVTANHQTGQPVNDVKNKTTLNNTTQNNVDQNKTTAISNNQPGNNLSNPALENFNRKKSNEIIVTSVIPKNNNSITGSGINNGIVKPDPDEKINNTVVAGINKGNTDPTTTAAIPVVYANASDENNNDRFLYMDEEKVKRTMLGGFIRKAKRILERNTNIKTGEGLKVAGFEIALK